LLYDLLCRVFTGRRNGEAWIGLGVLTLVCLASWLACQWFAGRAAFLLIGGMIATAMSANVFFWIIPGQRKVVAAMTSGQKFDPKELAIHGKRGKQRSVHNTYFTLPVLIAMLSNHYGWLYQGTWNWVVLFVLMLAGALIRHSFVARHRALIEGRRVPWEIAGAGVVLILALVLGMKPAPVPSAPAAAVADPVTAADMRAVVEQRCLVCHNAQMQQKNVALHTPELLKQHAQSIYQQVSVLKLMPMNNATQITDAERDLVRRWWEAGAPVR
jgi:uncharacterized membrane protein